MSPSTRRSPSPSPDPVDAGPGGISRRHFLAGASAVGLSTLVLPSLSPRLAFGAPGSGDVLVLVLLRGGADGLSLVPPFSDTAGYQALRGAGTGNDVAVPPPAVGDPANTAIDLGVTHQGHSFGLHPAMTGLATVWSAGHLAIVHGAGQPASESATRSHFEAQDQWDRGTAAVGTTDGWVGRYLNTIGALDPLAAIAHDSSLPVALRGNPQALAVPDFADFEVDGFWDPAVAKTALGQLYADGGGPLAQQGHETLGAVDAMQAADPASHDLNPHLYPTSGPGRHLAHGLREVAQLVRADVGLRVAVVESHEHWDVHDDMGPVTGGAMRDRAAGLSTALTAFHDDLGADMAGVTLVTQTEFGRTINVNGSNGTDHGRGTCLMVMSGSANQGIHGDYPTGALTDGPEGDLTVANDYRAVIHEVLTKRLGATDLSTVFPGYSHTGDLGLVT